MVKTKTRNRVGAPNKKREEKKDPNTGFTLAQKDWIDKEAKGRGVDKTAIHREMAEMYITAVESQRGDSIVADLFDTVDKLDNVNKK